MISMPKVQVEYTKFFGGLDLENPVFSIKPGYLLSSLNYEPGVYGGYRRIGGYERFDGRTRPSTASYWLMPCTITGTITAGDTITGAVSGETAKVLQVNSSELVLGRVSGTFGAAESITVGGTPVATTTGNTTLNSATTSYLSSLYRSLAADDYRADITAVPGSGGILGVILYNDVLYAWRNNAGGTAANMYKSTASGWTQVTFEYEVFFTSGGTATPVDGATLTQGGVTATVRRVLTRTGAWGGTAAGSFVISVPAGGSFASGAATLTGGATVTLSGAETAITLSPSGRYEFDIANFYGQQNKTRVYGCDGANPAFEFDGTYFVPIHTGMTTDTPSHVIVHKKHLFLMFESSTQHSGIGEPYSWTPVTGALEIALGETGVGYARLPGNALGIYTRNSASQLLGSSEADWQLDILSQDTGALPYTIQNVGYTYALDDRGIVRYTHSQRFGNFESDTMSRSVQSLIDTLKPLVVASDVNRKRNQYRLFCSDGRGVIMSVEGDRVTGIMPLEYPANVTCAWSGEDSAGTERSFFGDDSGFVYESEVGSSFDGAQIDSFILIPYNTSKTPRYRKMYRKIVLEMDSEEYSEIKFFPEFSYGDQDVSQHLLLTATLEGVPGGFWDVSAWDTFFYDGKSTEVPEFSIAGVGNSLSVLFYSRSAIDSGHSLNGIMVHYTVRRISR